MSDDLEDYWADIRPRTGVRLLPAIGQSWQYVGASDESGLVQGDVYIVRAVEPKCGERTVKLETGPDRWRAFPFGHLLGGYYVRVVVGAGWQMPATWIPWSGVEDRDG